MNSTDDEDVQVCCVILLLERSCHEQPHQAVRITYSILTPSCESVSLAASTAISLLNLKENGTTWVIYRYCVFYTCMSTLEITKQNELHHPKNVKNSAYVTTICKFSDTMYVHVSKRVVIAVITQTELKSENVLEFLVSNGSRFVEN